MVIVLGNITLQEQRQFAATMQMIVPQVIDRMVKEYGMEAGNAMMELYTSQPYADLERESS